MTIDALMDLYNQHHDELVAWIRRRFKVDKSIAENVVVATFEQVRDSNDLDVYSIAAKCVPAEKKRIRELRRAKSRLMYQLA